MSANGEMTTAQAVRSMLLLMPRLVGRAKRLPVPVALRGLDLAPRHLALLAYLQYDGPLTVSQLADRLEVAPTTVSLMVGGLSRHGILTREEDDADRRRRIVAIAPGYAAPITEWLSGSATAWTEALASLTPAERATIVATMRAYEAALDKHIGTWPALPRPTAATSSPLLCAAHRADTSLRPLLTDGKFRETAPGPRRERASGADCGLLTLFPEGKNVSAGETAEITATPLAGRFRGRASGCLGWLASLAGWRLLAT